MEFVRQRVYEPVRKALSSGITPHGLALATAFAFSGGMFPVPGTTTFVCLFFTLLFKLNGAIVQVVNLLLTPVGFMMLPVFINLGGMLIPAPAGSDGGVPSSGQLLALVWKALSSLDPGPLKPVFGAFAGAVAAWFLAVPFMTACVYLLTRPVFGYFLRDRAARLERLLRRHWRRVHRPLVAWLPGPLRRRAVGWAPLGGSPLFEGGPGAGTPAEELDLGALGGSEYPAFSSAALPRATEHAPGPPGAPLLGQQYYHQHQHQHQQQYQMAPLQHPHSGPRASGDSLQPAFSCDLSVGASSASTLALAAGEPGSGGPKPGAWPPGATPTAHTYNTPWSSPPVGANPPVAGSLAAGRPLATMQDTPAISSVDLSSSGLPTGVLLPGFGGATPAPPADPSGKASLLSRLPPSLGQAALPLHANGSLLPGTSSVLPTASLDLHHHHHHSQSQAKAPQAASSDAPVSPVSFSPVVL
ncbi:hypothetical protein H696_01486 [Fonticula alba]|uniref:DUF2062 domain-containing protein n=1 Tax=Fonticula alba TaxID=691883 RepID=A0A058ZDS5_FONAL|nr:hypothetical protein H696_01486 [Fonticula alba]KCV72078.1 hypothetical protein H696_01486 [Fonticula alba]|eukprot:XP_009493656.1 hypothetical protein H696_01486 [Fonticula alba]